MIRLAGLSVVFFALTVMAQPPTRQLGPVELVRNVIVEVLAAVKSNQQLTAADKQKALKLAEEKVLPHIDFAEATRLAVGRAWAQATPEQRKQLTDEFRRMLVRLYFNAIGGYEAETMKSWTVRLSPNDIEATVHDQYTRASSGRPVQVDYQMRKTDSGWKIHNIVIEGVSLVLTYRSEFDAVVKQSGIEGLLKRLAEKNAPAKAD